MHQAEQKKKNEKKTEVGDVGFDGRIVEGLTFDCFVLFPVSAFCYFFAIVDHLSRHHPSFLVLFIPVTARQEEKGKRKKKKKKRKGERKEKKNRLVKYICT